MKNIHLLPTDKPSRLWKNNLLQGKLELSKEILIGSNTAQNIYITSEEKIKKGDWYIADNKLYRASIDHMPELYTHSCKKIILTTNQDLINDGMQEIDDEFLEWFVKNPNCEEIEVVDVRSLGVYGSYYPYKINISKEESTFYTKKCKCMIFEPNCFTGMCKNCGGILKEETKPKTMLESLQEYLKNTPKEKVLEEAAEKYSENWEEITGLDYENTVPSEVNKLDFINGAKWQQEQNKNLYSEEDLLKFGAFVRIEDKKEKRLFLIQDYFKKWKQI